MPPDFCHSIPIKAFLPFTFPIAPGKPLIWVLSLWIYLFWIFYIKMIVQYVTFCVWLLSLSIIFWMFIHIVACASTLYLFMSNILLYRYVSLFMHSFVNEHLSCFNLLAILNSTSVNIYVYVLVSGPVFSSLAHLLGVGLWGHVVILCLTFEEPSDCFPQ